VKRVSLGNQSNNYSNGKSRRAFVSGPKTLLPFEQSKCRVAGPFDLASILVPSIT
jgi:hypothetical protein